MKRILIKISGEAVGNAHLPSIIQQIKQLSQNTQISILIGGGNFFRGSQQGTALGIDQGTADEVGMLATVMNGLILQSLFNKIGLSCVILSALPCPTLAQPISNQTINKALKKNKIIIFTGGTGNPFFTTDTAAVVRAIQIGANEVWKATKVDGVYTQDPIKHSNATPIKRIRYDEVLASRLQIMDFTAITLAEKHSLPIKVFNIFSEQALIKALNDDNFGSLITK